MKLQILIPQYKEDEEIIKPLLDSINNQINVDFKTDIGVIIVNDGSDVKLNETFLKNYKYDIKYVCAEHGGVSATRNVCLEYATADYIMFCDADDRFYNMLGLWFILKEIDKKPFDVFVSKFLSELYDELSGKLYYTNIDSTDCTFVHGKVYRRQFLLNNDIWWNNKLTLHEDCYFNTLAQILSKETRRCETPFYMWCYRPDSVSRSDEHFVLKTYKHYISSKEALVKTLLERDMYGDAIWQFMTTLYQLYYRINKDEWFESKYRKMAENRFKRFFKKYEDLYHDCPEDIKHKALSNAVTKAHNSGLLYEKILFEDWLNTIR